MASRLSPLTRAAVLRHGALLAAHRRPPRKSASRFQRKHRRLFAARDRISESETHCRTALPSIPITRASKRPSPLSSESSPDELLLTNGTDEAIQVLINTYVDDGDEVIVLRPSYAMYRFYAEVAGAKIIEIDYNPPALSFPLEELLAAITPAHPRRADLESRTIRPAPQSISRRSNRF